MFRHNTIGVGNGAAGAASAAPLKMASRHFIGMMGFSPPHTDFTLHRQ